MIIVRRNKDPKDPKNLKMFNVYLKLEDGTEHEIKGVALVKQYSDNLPATGCPYVYQMYLCDHCVRFE